MRETADRVEPDGAPAAPEPPPARPTAQDQPGHTDRQEPPGARTEPAQAAGQGDARPARVSAGPAIAMTAETITAAGAALWHVGGWTAVGLGAAGLAGAGAAAVGRRRRTGSWQRTRTRTWSTSSGGGRRSASFGRSSGGSSAGRRARSGMPSLGGGRARGGAGRRAGTRMPGMPKRAAGRGFPGVGSWRGRGWAGGRAPSPNLNPALRAARRTARAAGSALDRAAAGAARGRAAARAARQAARSGGTPRAAGRAARAALRDAHRTQRRRGAWRRLAGSLAWGAAGWTYGHLHAWNRSVSAGLGELVALRRGRPRTTPGPQRPRINTTVNRPTSPTAGTDSTGGADTMAKKGGGVPQFVHAAQEFAEALRSYEPPQGPGGMVQMYADMGLLPDALEEVAKGFSVFADRARNDLPLHSAISEFVHELAQTQAGMASVAAEIKPAIEKLHETDLDRHRAPRPAEHLWDVG